MRFSIFCWILGVLALPLDALAQPAELNGLIRDAEGLALAGVNIRLDGTTQGTTSNPDGRYTLTGITPGTYTVIASFIGFREGRARVRLAERDVRTLDFTLEELVVQSGEVVVTAGRRAQLTQDVPVSLTVVSPRELETRNIVALDQALQYVPGVQLQGSQVNVRGSSGFSYNTGSRVLMLLDGIPLLTPDSDGFPFDALPFAQIEQIEVFKGPGSALYGSGALGGVINIITKDFPSTPETSVRAFSGVYEPARYPIWYEHWPDGDAFRPFGGVTVTHAQRVGAKFGYWVNLAYRQDEGFMNFNKTQLMQGYTKLGYAPSPTKRFDVLLGVMSRTKDSFLFWNGARDALQPGNVVLGQSSDPNQPPSGTSDNNTNQVSLMPTFTHLLGPNLFYSAKLRLFGTLIRPISDTTGEPRDFSDGTVGFRYGGEVQVNWERKEGQYLVAGVTGDALATRSSFYVTTDGDELGSQPESAAFAQWEQALGPVNLTAGLRFDGYRIDASTSVSRLSPKIGVAYAATDAFTLRAAFGQGFRVPSLAERFTDNQDFFPIVRNPTIRPEESTSYEVGVRGLVLLGKKDGLQADVALFWNEFENLVEPKLIPEKSAFQFVNLTRARVRGFEVALDAALLADRLQLRFGYTFLDGDDLELDVPLSFRPPHLIKTGFDAQLYGHLDLGLDYRFAAAPERIDSDFVSFVPDADVLEETHIVDTRIGTRWRWVRVAFHVKNALEYYALARPALLAPPRHYQLQVQVDF